MKKKLPVVTSKPTPADVQVAATLSAKPVMAGSRSEFPTRGDMYRRAGLLGGTLLAGLGATACSSNKPPIMAPAPAPQAEPATPDVAPKVEDSKPAPEPVAVKPAESVPTPPAMPAEPVAQPVAMTDGSVNGKPVNPKMVATFKVYRDGGGIGPAEDMWEPTEVEAFITWTLAKEGKLNLKTGVKFEHEGISLELDGYDADKKIGYEYLDKLSADPAFTKEVRAKLDAWMKSKKVAILLIDMKKTPDQATLKGKIIKFVAELKKSPPTPGPL